MSYQTVSVKPDKGRLMQKNTSEKLLDAAETLFAARGFYGVSIAAIADELGLTKQALLHHFGSKEKLYAAVLARISAHYAARQAQAAAQGDAAAALKAYLLQLAEDALADNARTRLLMRELLDNNARAAAAENWFLAGFLERLGDMLLAAPAGAGLSRAAAQARAYQLLGAINYFAVSQPTLTGIFGAGFYAEMRAAFPGELARLIDAALAA